MHHTLRISTLLLTALLAPVAEAASADNNVEWDGVFSDTTANFVTPATPVAGSPLTIKLRAKAGDLTGALVRIWISGPNMEQRLPLTKASAGTRFDLWSAQLTVPGTATHMYFRFEATDGTDTDYYDAGAPADAWSVRGMSDDYRGDDYNFKLVVGQDAPAWSKTAVGYQIFPDRFNDGVSSNNVLFPDDCFWYLDYAPADPIAVECAGYTVPKASGSQTKFCENHESWSETPNGGPCDFFGGDLQGITQKLGYLKDLGVDQVYLNPIFRSPSNHKYDTMDYDDVDPRFGGTAAAQSLTAAAADAGMYVVADGVFNHGSDLGKQYNGWLNYANTAGTLSGVDAYPSSCGAWEDQYSKKCSSSYNDWFKIWSGTDQYDVDRDGDKSESAAHTCGWYGFEFMPDFDYKSFSAAPNSSARKWLYGGTAASDPTSAKGSVAGKWLVDGGALTSGFDGWRLDVPDNAGYFTNSTAGDCSKTANDTSIWKGFRSAVKTVGKDRLIIGEIWTDATRNSGVDYTSGTFDGVMNYHYFGMPMSCFITGVGVHNDGSECTNDYAALTLGKASAVDALDSHLATGRRVYPAPFYMSSWNILSSHDTARFVSRAGGDTGKYKTAALFQATLPGAPMIYYGDELGVTGANNELGRATFPWTSLDNAASPQALLRETVRSLMCVRSAYPALATGSFVTLWTNNTEKTYGYGRFDAQDRIAVAINNDGVARTVKLPVDRLDVAEGARLVDVLTGQVYTVASGSVTVSAPARGGVILVDESRSSTGRACMDRNDAPSATAADVTIKEGEVAVLDGSGSSDPEGAALSYLWTDAAGAEVGTVPVVQVTDLPIGTYSYRLTVKDGVYTSVTGVTVTVQSASGGCSTSSGRSGSGWAGLAVVVLAGMGGLFSSARRRRD